MVFSLLMVPDVILKCLNLSSIKFDHTEQLKLV